MPAVWSRVQSIIEMQVLSSPTDDSLRMGGGEAEGGPRNAQRVEEETEDDQKKRTPLVVEKEKACR